MYLVTFANGDLQGYHLNCHLFVTLCIYMYICSHRSLILYVRFHVYLYTICMLCRVSVCQDAGGGCGWSWPSSAGQGGGPVLRHWTQVLPLRRTTRQR